MGVEQFSVNWRLVEEDLNKIAQDTDNPDLFIQPEGNLPEKRNFYTQAYDLLRSFGYALDSTFSADIQIHFSIALQRVGSIRQLENIQNAVTNKHSSEQIDSLVDGFVSDLINQMQANSHPEQRDDISAALKLLGKRLKELAVS